MSSHHTKDESKMRKESFSNQNQSFLLLVYLSSNASLKILVGTILFSFPETSLTSFPEISPASFPKTNPASFPEISPASFPKTTCLRIYAKTLKNQEWEYGRFSWKIQLLFVAITILFVTYMRTWKSSKNSCGINSPDGKISSIFLQIV